MTSLDELNALAVSQDKSIGLFSVCDSPDPNSVTARYLRAARSWVAVSPFSVGVGLKKEDGSGSTYWIGNSSDCSWLAEYRIVGALTPIGRVILEFKNLLKDGRIPERIAVKRPRWVGDRVGERGSWACSGSLVDVISEAGRQHAIVRQVTVWSPSRKGKPVVRRPGTATSEPEAVLPPVSEKPGFGLTDVVSALDTDQLRNVDFPDDGPLVVTGCAGTGKTTVALYRALYLLEEQRAVLRDDPNAEVHFSENKFLVLVRKEHLRPYLASLASSIAIPRIQVAAFDPWFQETVFRRYLRGGRQRARFTSVDQPDWERWTHALSENDVATFLRDDLPEHFAPWTKECREFLREVQAETAEWLQVAKKRSVSLDRHWERDVVQPARMINANWRTIEECQRFFERIGLVLSKAESSLKDVKSFRGIIDSWLKAATEWQKELRAIRAAVLDEAFRFDLLVKKFYASTAAKAAFSRVVSDVRPDEISAILSAPERPLHRADQAVAAWMIEFMTEHVTSGPEHLRPLPRYDHLVLDEAQFYPPVIARLLQRLARPPRRAITIVGDLDQRFGDSGLDDWRGLLPPDSENRVKRLNRIYRCSRETYAFLFEFHSLLGFTASLVPPRDVDRFSSRPSLRKHFPSADAELDWLVDGIETIKANHSGESVVVILPDTDELIPWRKALLQRLDDIGVARREAHGEDMHQSVSKVIITDPESVVGLEFDSVFIPNLAAWPDVTNTKNRNRLWVSASRAKRFWGLSSSGAPLRWLPANFGVSPIKR